MANRIVATQFYLESVGAHKRIGEGDGNKGAYDVGETHVENHSVKSPRKPLLNLDKGHLRAGINPNVLYILHIY